MLKQQDWCCQHYSAPHRAEGKGSGVKPARPGPGTPEIGSFSGLTHREWEGFLFLYCFVYPGKNSDGDGGEQQPDQNSSDPPCPLYA